MDQAETVIAAIDDFQGRTGQSDRAISMAVTGKPDMVRKLRETRRPPRSETLQKLAEHLGMPIERMLGTLRSNATLTDHRIEYRPQAFGGGGLRDLPILGTALGHSLSFDENGGAEIEQTLLEPTEVIRNIARPAVLVEDPHAYAVYIQGDSMSPRYEPGELAVVSTRKAPQLGDDVIVQLTGSPEDGTGDEVVCVLIKRLVRRSASWVELRQFNPPCDFRVERARVRHIHRITPIGDMLGA